MKRRILAYLALIALLGGCGGELTYPPGQIAPNQPIQLPPGDKPFIHMDEYLLRPVARFEVEARVLGRERYRSDRESDLSPMDLALGWGPMSDQAVLDNIRITQHGRFYWWKPRRGSIGRRDIIRNSSNMHLIPATEDVRRDLMRVREGEIVRFSGYLVNVRGPDGWRWISSTSRDDSGAGACELIWVEELVSYPGDNAQG